MAKIPAQETTVKKIYKSYEAEQGGHRPHLGASQIGEPCERKLWYGFRHAYNKTFPGRVLRLFLRGHNEEITFNNELSKIGVEVVSHDDQGNQISFSQPDNPHFSGSMDAALKGLVEAPKTWHVADYKTSDLNQFKAFLRDGLMKWKPTYYAQLMVYMGWSGMTRAIIFVACKNDDEIASERIKFVKEGFDYYISKAKRVVYASRPLAMINTKLDWHECKFCDAIEICKQDKVAAVNCRTCCHATPLPEAFEDTIDGKPKTVGLWKCEKHGYKLMNNDQAIACGDHLFIPDLIPAEMIKGDTGAGWIQYEKEDGTIFVNSGVTTEKAAMLNYYSSVELENNFAMVGNKGVEQLREGFGATIGKTIKVLKDEDIPY